MLPFNPFSALTSKIFGGAAIALALVAGVQTIRANHYEHSRDEWKQAHAAQKAAYEAAQDAARAKAIAAKIEQETRYADLARQSRQSARAADFRRDARRFADAQRVRTKAVEGAAGGTASPGEDSPAPVDNGPGDRSEYVWLRRDQFDAFVENTDRLIQVKEWGDRLIADGLAVPEPEFGGE